MTRLRPCSAVPGLLLALTLVGCGRPAELRGEPSEATRRTIAQGEVIGFAQENGADAWLGIPFAQPPVGELRWKAPRPPSPWQEPLEATAFGPTCPQFAWASGGRDGADAGEPTGSEDCLHLNVFAPRFAPEAVPGAGERLPVMVWIHGGGNTIGDAVLYDGSVMAAEGDVVVVTVHYRLGVLGWWLLSRSARGLRTDSCAPVSTNPGLLMRSGLGGRKSSIPRTPPLPV